MHRSVVRCVSLPQPKQWFCVDLRDKRIAPTHYTLRHYDTYDSEALRTWQLQGSNDGVTWDILRQHFNDKGLDRKGATYTWPIWGARPYRLLRIVQTGVNSNNNHYLACSGMEVRFLLPAICLTRDLRCWQVYGTLTDLAVAQPQAKTPALVIHPPQGSGIAGMQMAGGPLLPAPQASGVIGIGGLMPPPVLDRSGSLQPGAQPAGAGMPSGMALHGIPQPSQAQLVQQHSVYQQQPLAGWHCSSLLICV